MNVAIKIAGKEYSAAPLRLKHLRQISELLSKGIPAPKSGYEDIARWLPFVIDCIRVNHPDIDSQVADDMSAQEFHDAWKAIVDNSSVKLVPGEAQPTQQTGQGSMPN